MLLVRQLIVIVLAALCIWMLEGCTNTSPITDNSAMVDTAVRQAVFKYVDAGRTEADKDARAVAVVDTMESIGKYLEGSPTSDFDMLLIIIASQIRWEMLSVTDAAVLRDVMMLIRHNLQNRQSEGLLEKDAIVGLRALLQTVIKTARLL